MATSPPEPMPPTRVVPAAAHPFLAEPNLGVLATHRADGSIHAVPVAFMYDPADDLVRIIAPAATLKVANVRARPGASLCVVDGGRWATLEGHARVADDVDSVAVTRAAYTAKHGPPHESRDDYVSIELTPTKVTGRFVLPGFTSGAR